MVPGYVCLQRGLGPPVTGQPGDHDRCGTGGVAAQIVPLSGPGDHLDPLRRNGYAERIAVAVDDERGQTGRQFRLARALRPTRRVRRKREAHDPRGAEDDGCTAGDPGTAGPSADDQWSRPTERGHRRDPRRVELSRRSRRTPPGHPVRLGDPGHRDRGVERGTAYGQQVRRVDAASGTMAEDEQCTRRTRRLVVLDKGRAVRRRYLGQEATRSTSSTTGVRCFGINSNTRTGSGATGVSMAPVRHATSIARRSRGVVAPQTP